MDAYFPLKNSTEQRTQVFAECERLTPQIYYAFDKRMYLFDIRLIQKCLWSDDLWPKNMKQRHHFISFLKIQTDKNVIHTHSSYN